MPLGWREWAAGRWTLLTVSERLTRLKADPLPIGIVAAPE
jgi:hypothetical protein